MTRIMLHADHCTIGPTTFTADRALRDVLGGGEVAMALQPFPTTNDSDEVVLYGTPDQLRDLATSLFGAVDDFEGD